MKLFCFTYAGGTADFYIELRYKLKDKDIDLVALEYPGHGKRWKEKFAADFSEIADDMIRQIESCLEEFEEYALMGYSMGCLTAIEVLRCISQRERFHLPKYIFLAAHEPRTLSILSGIKEDEVDNVIKNRTISFGAVPEKLINNQTFWRMYLPVYRADYKIISSFDFESFKLKMTIPTTVFYSETDTPFGKVSKWNNYFCGNLKFYQFEGDHFFIKNNIMKIADIIKQRMAE